MSVTREYVVTGMTCQHCVSAVAEEVGTMSGVIDVQVELESGQLVVTSEDEIAYESLEAAVDEAGYTLRAA